MKAVFLEMTAERKAKFNEVNLEVLTLLRSRFESSTEAVACLIFLLESMCDCVGLADAIMLEKKKNPETIH
jgi:hypothetical protein